ncbi:MAG: TIGR03118 family protein [Abitibacteriaceae bacterium]|nr:TIGR03118 family protein [Abditibacteriaceae bacterium]
MDNKFSAIRHKTSNRVLTAVGIVALGLMVAGCGGGGGSNNLEVSPTPTPGVVTTSLRQTNLVSDQAGVAARRDANLVNPWGLVVGPSGNLQVADNGTGVATAYTSAGNLSTPTIRIPTAAGQTGAGKPTGIVVNNSSRFFVPNGSKSAPGTFIFAGEDGTISVWNASIDPITATRAVDRSNTGAVYKGLAIASSGTVSTLYAANFHSGAIDIFNDTFTYIRSFSDSTIPAGFAPFNIQNINGRLYVTYAKQEAPQNEDDQPGAGNGFVDVFDIAGHLLKRLVSQGQLNSPWGLALAPAKFGNFSNALLVGNFGDGRINAFDVNTGKFLGTLKNAQGNPITISGLWSLAFANANGGSGSTLFFTAGTGDEKHGLFGKLELS